MSVIAYLQTNGCSEKQLPDLLFSTPKTQAPDGDFVISRTPDGTVISRYKDDVWNMKPYCAANTTIYNFTSWSSIPSDPLAETIQEEMKQIQLARLYLYRTPRKVNSVLLVFLRQLARFAYKNGITLTKLFSDEGYHPLFLSSFAEIRNYPACRQMLSLVKELFEIHATHPEFNLCFRNGSLIKSMEGIASQLPRFAKNDQQTKLIPSRLYAAYINSLSQELDMFNSFGPALVDFHEERSRNSLFAIPTLRAKKYRKSITWELATSDMGLTDFCQQEALTGLRSLQRYLSAIQASARLFIHFFTGMRATEARFLPADTYTTIEAGEATITILKGYTSKISSQNHTPTYWVTTPIVEKAILAAKYLGRISAIKHGFDDSDPSKYPLFPQLDATRGKNHFTHFPTAPVTPHIAPPILQDIRSRSPDTLVREEDIRELEQFDGFRDWRNDKDIFIGQPWPLATHQCRRSLAVYSARSGMVSLGSLAMQFKHLTEAMTSYYRRNGAFAVNFIKADDQLSLIDEFERERQKQAYMQYESDVINSGNRLWGGEGNRIQVARDKGRPLVITTDRSETEQKFYKGEMTYKEGPLGGCTNLEPCDKISFFSVMACIDCEKSILDNDKSVKKISYAIRNMENSRNRFDTSSPFYQQMTKEIEDIYAKVERAGLTSQLENFL